MGQKRTSRAGVPSVTPRLRTPARHAPAAADDRGGLFGERLFEPASPRLPPISPGSARGSAHTATPPASARSSPRSGGVRPAAHATPPGSARSRGSSRSPRSAGSGGSAKAGGERLYELLDGQDYRREQPRSRRPRKFDARPPSDREVHPLGRWNPSPRHNTQTEMGLNRQLATKPDPSFDVDGDGTVSADDFKLACTFDADGNGVLDDEERMELRRVMSKKKIGQIMQMLKTTRGEKLAELREMWMGLSKPLEKDLDKLSGEEIARIQGAFAALDTDGSNSIDREEVQGVFTELTGKASKEQVDAALAEMDTDNDNEVSYAEFKDWWQRSAQRALMAEDDVVGLRVGGHKPVTIAGLDLASDLFRTKIDKLAAEARMSNSCHNSTSMAQAMAQNAMFNPVPKPVIGSTAGPGQDGAAEARLRGGEDDGKTRGGAAHKASSMMKPPSPVRRMVNGVMETVDRYSDEGDPRAPSQHPMTLRTMAGEAAEEDEPALFEKGSDVFRLVTEKLEQKTANVAKLFRKFDENKDGTVDYRELRQGLQNINVSLDDDQFAQLVNLVDADKSGDIDYQEFANADIMGSPLFSARSVQGNSGCSTRGGLLAARGGQTRQFCMVKNSKHHQTYLHGGMEGYFRGALDPVAGKGGLAPDNHIYAARALEPPWATGYADDPRSLGGNAMA
jgi:Ca2+-binding EF-hand superfamily protein